MLAADVKPNRLERAKLALTDFTGKLDGDRVGLIAFAGSAFLQCPLTTDYSGFALTVRALSTDIIPRGGLHWRASYRKLCARSRERGQEV
jgi:Ca-activated chloride channel family protein